MEMIDVFNNPNFIKALHKTLLWEGGFADHPLDHGGPTNKGVTLRLFQKYFGNDKTVLDLQKMSVMELQTVYYKEFWVPGHIDSLPVEVQDVFFDMAVNHGVRNATWMLQQVINSFTEAWGHLKRKDYIEKSFISCDKIMGPDTIKAANDVPDKKEFRSELIDRRLNFYDGIVASHPNQEVFLKGWINRGESYRTVA